MSGERTALTAGKLDLARAREVLAGAMSPEELRHCERTSETARELAVRFGEDVERATYAGLVHDIARAMRDSELLAVARRYDIPVSNVDRMRPYLLHAEVGAHLVCETLDVDDPIVLSAVASHTFGRVGMTDLEKIIYLADTIEPARDYPGVEELRDAAGRDLDEAMRASYRRAICHLTERGKPLHPRTVDVWNWLCLETGG
jgi:predicted HD superfamily hydrolase involved in NAD metabolism